jgi:hypothetical protein
VRDRAMGVLWSLDTDTARAGRSLYLVGGGLALASTIWALSVTSTLLGTKVLPAWYLGAERWAEGLATAYFALLAPIAMVCFGLGIVSTRRFPLWTGVVLLIAATALFAVFRGALPFPQFLAFIALGIAARVRPPAPASPAPSPVSPHLAADD